jgi:hypothetical protein
MMSGYGVYNWPNGKRYEGEFQEDKKKGEGKLYMKEKLIY